MDPITIAGLALSAGSLAAGFFNKGSRPKVPDISAELGRIRALYDQARTAARANINAEAATGRQNLASNLATRGILRAPVSAAFGARLEDFRLREIANAEGQIAGQEAGAMTNALAALIGAEQNAQERNAQINAQRFGQLGALGSTLLMAGLNNRPGAGRVAAPGVAGQSFTTPQGFAFNPASLATPSARFNPALASLFRRTI